MKVQEHLTNIAMRYPFKKARLLIDIMSQYLTISNAKYRISTVTCRKQMYTRGVNEFIQITTAMTWL